MFFILDDDTKIGSYGKRIRRMTRVEAGMLKNSVDAALKNKLGAVKYIEDLIRKVASNTGAEIISVNILDLFDKVFESRGDDPIYGGIWIFTESVQGSFAVNHWAWVNGKGSAEIYMHFSNQFDDSQDNPTIPPPKVGDNISTLKYLNSPRCGGMPTIHELMHVSVKGHLPNTNITVGKDADFAYAAADLAGYPRPVFIPSEAVIYPNDLNLLINSNILPHLFVTPKIGTTASAYWDARLNHACGYPSNYSPRIMNFDRLYKEEKK